MLLMIFALPFPHISHVKNMLDVKKSPSVQAAFWSTLGLISSAGVTGNMGTTDHAHVVQMSAL